MIIDPSNAKLFANIGSRATFGLVALELKKKEKDLLMLTADVSTSAGLDRFKIKFPDSFIDVGIAEQNLISVASGLSTLGFNVFTTTFVPFQTMRCLEQIKVNLGYMKKKITMVGLAGGLVLGPLGYTHCSIEDLSVIRSIPNIAVISPADCSEIAKAVFAAAKHSSSVYIRLTGGSGSGMIYDKDYDFRIGKPIRLKEGKDGIIFSNGFITYNCLKAAHFLKEKNNLDLSVVNVHTLKPLKDEDIKVFLKNVKNIFTIEEHSLIGGLNSVISEIITRNNINIFNYNSLGINDSYVDSGTYQYMLKKNKLDLNGIIEFIQKKIK